jgi:hypothetical protein
MALSDLSFTAVFLCLRVAVLLARAGAAPEDTTGSELLLFVAIQDILSQTFQLEPLILPDFTARTAKSFYQSHHHFGGRDVSANRRVSDTSVSTEVY